MFYTSPRVSIAFRCEAIVAFEKRFRFCGMNSSGFSLQDFGATLFVVFDRLSSRHVLITSWNGFVRRVGLCEGGAGGNAARKLDSI